ncbi:hypothetical protein BGZ76_005289 [Entomortierella beljakovae]|nr:hypothetical protein BGZ76_005289 [Entomortierella beljakovae]
MYVDTNDIVSCAIVSKAWHQVYISLLWKSVIFDFQKRIPTKAVLSKYAHLVNSLTIYDEMPSYVTDTTFPCLQKLVITGFREIEFSALMLSNNPTIQDFTLRYHVFVVDIIKFWETLSALDHLRRIDFSCFMITPDLIDPFWKTLSGLEVARLHDFTFSSEVFGQSKELCKLKSLTVFNTINPLQQLKFIENLPELESLDLNICVSGCDLADCFTRVLWSNLHIIRLFSVELDDANLQNVFLSITRLTSVSIGIAKWGVKSFIALSRHFPTLERFESNNSELFTSVMVNTVMCSCPRLIELRAGVIRGIDIIENNRIECNSSQSQEWVCTELLILVLRFNLEGVNSQIPIIEKLARFTRLRRLETRQGYFEIYHTLSLSLDKGLALLKSLKDLQRISFSEELKTEADREWVFQNWKKLSVINGRPYHR